MKLPFTVEQFLKLFADYNQSIFPLQFLFYLLAALVVYVSLKKFRNSGRIINSVLAFLWLWNGLVYHLLFFSNINGAAYLFGIAFIVQAILFFYYGVLNNMLTYNYKRDKAGLAGAVLITYALVVYPLLGYLFGHVYPESPTFGVPCPTTIFTFGVLLWIDCKVPPLILVIPALWSVLGFTAATKLGIREDFGLLVAGIIATLMLLFRRQPLPYSHD
jgi:hypothetical protein